MKKLNELQLFEGDSPSKEGDPFFSRDYLLKPDISPFLVYMILKETFGMPNGDSLDEDKSQWEWRFTFSDYYIEIYDWKLTSSSIAIYHQFSEKSGSQILAERINRLLTNAAQQKKSKIKSVIKNAKHKVLENPFITYYSTAEDLMQIASAIDEQVHYASPSVKLSNGFPTSLPDGLDLLDCKSALYRSAFLMFLSSFEGFLNIIYELYLKRELRESRLYDKIAREQIDVKLRIVPIYCTGFRAITVDHEDERFKRYLRLVSLRNDYVHANVIKSLERYIVEEDDHRFILQNEEGSEIPSNINELELKHVEMARKCIDDVVELVLEAMQLKTRREFKKVIYEREIEVKDVDGVLMPIH